MCVILVSWCNCIFYYQPVCLSTFTVATALLYYNTKDHMTARLLLKQFNQLRASRGLAPVTLREWQHVRAIIRT